MRDLLELMKGVLGLTCSQIQYGPDESLWLSLGELIPYGRPLLKGQAYGTYEFRSAVGSWRIHKDWTTLASATEGEERAEEAFQGLMGQTLERIEPSPTRSDLRLYFSQGLVVEFFQSSRKKATWSIIGPFGQIAVGPGPVWAKSQREPLTPKEERMLTLPTVLVQRWVPQFPLPQGSGSCRGCAYSIRLTGSLFFSDLGLCSHPESSRDGRVIYLDWGCTHFSSDLDISDPPSVQEIMAPMLGQTCSIAVVTEEKLEIGFGPLVESSFRVVRTRGTWTFCSASGAWRILQNGSAISSKTKSIESLLGRNLERFEFSGESSDFRAYLSQGMILEFLEVGSPDVSWRYRGPRESIDFRPGPVTGEARQGHPCVTIFPVHDVASYHEEATADRWDIPQSDIEQCQDCTAFVLAQGKTWLSGYGLCTQETSPREGLVTERGSSCRQFEPKEGGGG